MNICVTKSFKDAAIPGMTVAQSHHGLYHVVYDDVSKDVRPAADFVVAAVQQRREELGPDTKIAVLMGEIHTVPTHLFLQQAVNSRLLDAGVNFVSGYEHERNWWKDESINIDAKIGKSLGNVGYTFELDPMGDAGLSYYLHKRGSLQASVSHFTQMAFDYYNRIPARFVDSYKTFSDGTSYVDIDDPSFEKYRDSYVDRAASAESGNEFDVRDRDGMQIRNIVMAHNIDCDPAKTIVMKTGAAHIIKSESNPGLMLPSALSLKSQNIHVISVVPYWNQNSFFAKHGDTILIDGLNVQPFEIKKCDSAEPILKQEIVYAQEVQKASGNEVSLFLREFFRRKEIFGPAFARHRQEVIDAYHAQASAQAQKPAAPSL